MCVRAVFLDRDGVINADRADYVKSLAELRVFPFVPAAVQALNEAGMVAIVVSNQQGVAKGLMTEDNLREIQEEITRQVSGGIEAFYYCLHMAAENCACRKPRPGLILTAAQEHGIDLAASYVVGDSERDIMAGKSAGCKTVLVLTGKLTRQDAANIPCKPDFVAEDLLQAVEWIVKDASASPRPSLSQGSE